MLFPWPLIWTIIICYKYRNHGRSPYLGHSANARTQSSALSFLNSMASRSSYPSTTSLQSSTSITSTTPLSSTQKPQKDYSAAFGNLQSRYGTGGHVPAPSSKRIAKVSASSSTTSSSTSTSQSTLTPPTGPSTNLSSGKGQEVKPKRNLLLSLLKGRLNGSGWALG